MKYFYGILDYANQDSVERLDGQLLHECLTQLKPEDFTEIQVKDRVHWLNFTEDVFKKMDLSHREDLMERVNFLLALPEKKGCCSVCGQIGLNQIMQTYRNNNGCVGGSIECRDCAPLINKDASTIRKAYIEGGTPLAIQKLAEFRINL